MWQAGVAGFALGGSLIVAIGAQNAFVIRQGIAGRHLFWICLFCALSDAVLIWSGVYGLSVVLSHWPSLTTVMTYGGAAFLAWYGTLALRRALHPAVQGAAPDETASLWRALAVCGALTWLNPHVYLDTVILLGSVANARPAGEQSWFAAGASLASLLWFYGIGYGANMLRGWLSRPAVWRVIDGGIAIIMFVLALKLLIG